MKKRFLVCLSLVLFCAAPLGLGQEAPVDLEDRFDSLQQENQNLRDQLNSLESKVEALADEDEPGTLDRLLNPERYYNLSLDDDPIRSGFIRKGASTGTYDKLLNVNIYTAARFSQISNDSAAVNDVDRFDVSIARLNLSGQAFTELEYKLSYDFNQDRLFEGHISWVPDMTGCTALDRFRLTVGLTQVFLSPEGKRAPWALDFIEYALIVTRFLPPGNGRDVGAFFQADAVDDGRLKIWGGVWNGTHRAINFPGTNFNSIAAFDAWGNGQDNDALATMARVQVNLLDEEQLFFMVSGGFERNKISYTLSQGVNPPTVHENKVDKIYNAATEFRFNERKTWVKGEFMHTYLADSSTNTQRGYYVAAGTLLDFMHPDMDHFEVMGRLDEARLNDSLHSADDITNKTLGLNYYFDPEHKHDAKLQINYVWRRDRGLNPSDNTLLVQFVLGF